MFWFVFSLASAFSIVLHHLLSAQHGDWKNRNIIHASPANCSGLPKCRVLTRSRSIFWQGCMCCVANACFCFSSDNCAVVQLTERRCRRDGTAQVHHTNRRRRKVNESLQRAVRRCGLQRCVMMMMMLGCSGTVALPLPLSPFLSLSLSLSPFLSHAPSFLAIRLPAYQNGFITLAFLPHPPPSQCPAPPLLCLSTTSPLSSSKILLCLEGH